jgi:two-component system sensor histidine kinase BaeS
VTRKRLAQFSSLATRLSLLFVGVAIGAILVLSLLVLIAAQHDVSNLARQQQDTTATDIAEAAASAYSQAGGWPNADLKTAVALAASADAKVAVHNAEGRSIDSPLTPHRAGRLVSRPVIVDGKGVGAVQILFPPDQLTGADRHLRDALRTTVIAGAAIAAALALVVGLAVARRITRPLVALTSTVRAVEAGERTARVGAITAPGEVAELAAAFDAMADALDEQDAMRQALVADVAHELRTPLTVLQASLEAMADGVVPSEPGHVASLRDDVLRLTRTVQDLEALAAADAAGVTLQTAPLDLAEVAAASAAALQHQFEAADLTLRTHLEPVTIAGDRHRLHQLITNLLTNALKFTPAGGRVDLDVRRETTEARLSVSDTGVGIANDELPHIFDRFWRGKGAQATAGSGIGLTVVARLANAHRGTYHADSQPGRGTCIAVSFPLA